MPKSIILDTDVGTDIDDAFAIVLALKSPELQIKGISTVYGDVNLRAKIVLKILKLAGREDIPVAAGFGKPITNKEIYWAGWEGKGFLTSRDENLVPTSKDVVDFISRKLQSATSKISLITIGPLTNIALLIQRKPELMSKIEEIIVMGGKLEPQKHGFKTPWDHNLNCDPRATEIVFTSKMPIILATFNVCRKAVLLPGHVEKMGEKGGGLLEGLLRMHKIRSEAINRDWTPMFDSVAVSLLFQRELVKMEKIHLQTKITGDSLQLIRKHAESNVEVTVDVQVEKFMNMFMARILS